MSLSGKVFVVTGATGGLGPAVTAALLDAGAAVAITARRADAVARTVTDHGGGDRLAGRAADLTDPDAVATLMQWADGRFGGLDGLIAVAGGFAGGSPVHETPVATWQAQLDLNLTSVFLSARAIAPYLIQRGGGSIVAFGTRPALRGAANLAAYSAAKGGLLRLVEAMADELKDHGITVNALLPSVIDTPDNRAASPDADTSRWVKPAEIAAVVSWLVGPEARIISGAAIPVYGRA
jgi:NAD(P)-dependent dehydrogenase (short-subunit alcohol dehydrogenase family)